MSVLTRSRHVRRYALALLLATLPIINSCAVTRWGGGSGTVFDSATKQPMAGVHVLIYLSTSTLSVIPWTRGTRSCGPEFYTVSDANGKFTIPEDALELPSTFSLGRSMTHFNATAYARGYFDNPRIESGIAFDGYTRTKVGPLVLRIAMTKDTQTLWERAKWLSQSTIYGCQCSELHRAMIRELEDISLPAEREEAARLNTKYIMSGAPGSQRDCEGTK